jgi:hypothetical protein
MFQLKKFHRDEIIILILLLVFFLAFQLYSVATSYINSDNAIVGLAAWDVLKGHWPVFFYGQSYMGTIETCLTALSRGN